jgi:hypothetical protein
MKALTVRQPWAGLIARGIKDVENRTWIPNLNLGDRFAVHAGRWDDIEPTDVDLDHPICRAHGLIVCTVRLVDVRRDAQSRWARAGAWHWVLDQPYMVNDARHMRGWRGLWELHE